MPIRLGAAPSAAGPISKEEGCGVLVVLCCSLAGLADFWMFSFVGSLLKYVVARSFLDVSFHVFFVFVCNTLWAHCDASSTPRR